MSETVYALESDVPQRKPFDVIDVLKTPIKLMLFNLFILSSIISMSCFT